MCGHGVDIPQPECSLAQRQWGQIKELPRSYPWGSARLAEVEGMVPGLGIMVGPGEGSSQLTRHSDSWHNPPWDTQTLVPAALLPDEKYDNGTSRVKTPDLTDLQPRSIGSGSPGDAPG